MSFGWGVLGRLSGSIDGDEMVWLRSSKGVRTSNFELPGLHLLLLLRAKSALLLLSPHPS